MIFTAINNLSVTTINDVSPTDTSLVLAGYTPLAEVLAANPGTTVPLTAELPSGDLEIVYVTAIESDTATVIRGREGTTAADLPADTVLEARTTAALLNNVSTAIVVDEQGNTAPLHGEGTAPPANVSWAVTIGEISAAESEGVSLGRESYAATKGVAIGRSAQASEFAAVALGSTSQAADMNAVALGRGAYAAGSAVSVGAFAGARSDESVTINTNADTYGVGAVVAGYGALAGEAANPADSAVAVGRYAQVAPGTQAGVSLGPAAVCTVPSGMRLTGIPYIAKEPDDTGTQSSANVSSAQAMQVSAARRVAASTVFATDPLDLTTPGSVTLELPPGVVMAIDSIDAMVVSASSPGGAPTIQVGNDIVPDKYIGTSAVTATVAGNRDTYSPASTDGATKVTATVVGAATGTLSVRIVVRGYVMEI